MLPRGRAAARHAACTGVAHSPLDVARNLEHGAKMVTQAQSHAKELERTYFDGEVIVEEGERTRDMFVIQSGEVRISKRVKTQDVELARLGQGDFFGEMSLLESLPRDATAHAVGETQLLVVSAGALLVRMRRDPTFAFEMLHRLSGRLRTLNARLVQVLEQTDIGEEKLAQLFYANTSSEDPPDP